MRADDTAAAPPRAGPVGAAEAPADGAFRLEGVTVRYGRNGTAPALDGVDLSVGRGEGVALVGPSGAGKSTLLHLLNGTVRPTAGRVHAIGRDLAELSAPEMRRLRAGIGFIHQHLGLVPNLSVLQNVLGGRLGRRGLLGSLRDLLAPARSDVGAAHRILERVGVGEKLYERTDRLSGGEMQRVAIARALLQDPAALLADEPVSSVDPARAHDTVELLVGVSRERGLTLCMSLHNLALARSFFPRLIGLRAGRVVFDRPAEEIDDATFAALYDLSVEEVR